MQQTPTTRQRPRRRRTRDIAAFAYGWDRAAAALGNPAADELETPWEPPRSEEHPSWRTADEGWALACAAAHRDA